MDIQPKRATVKPRCIDQETGDTVPLEDRVGSLLEEDRKGLVQIFGPSGSGKSTALQHLAAALPSDAAVCFLDGPSWPVMALEDADLLVSRVREREDDELVILAYSYGFPLRPFRLFELAPWGVDEAIEYLLAVHREKCASVMARVKAADDLELTDGSPVIWRIALESMAEEESVTSVTRALRDYLPKQLPDEALKQEAEGAALSDLLKPRTAAKTGIAPPEVVSPKGPDDPADHARSKALPIFRKLQKQGIDSDAIRVIRQRGPQLLLAVNGIIRGLRQDEVCSFLANRLPRDLVRRAGKAAASDPQALGRLEALLQGDATSIHPMAASILHASGSKWRPDSGGRVRLRGAYLPEVAWPHVDLSGMESQGADLSGANLMNAELSAANLQGCSLRGADLSSSSLHQASFDSANLSRANLRSARGEKAKFDAANLSSASLEGATFEMSSFNDTQLDQANLKGANLTNSHFVGAKIEDADFSHAILDGASFARMKLHEAEFRGARFVNAKITKCSFEGLELPGADFGGAHLLDCDFTGAVMSAANFRDASLYSAGLADVNWERVDLRNADLRKSTFHMGSSRSGLVFSPTASEGTRTGFYTDDYSDQDFRAPEEIRKANLRWADLRGANIEGVDFYLVDVRNAQLDPEQRAHLRKCGAILESKA